MAAGNAEISIDWTIEGGRSSGIIEKLANCKNCKGSFANRFALSACLPPSPLSLPLLSHLVKPPAINLYHHATSCSIIKNFSLVMRRLCRQLSLSQASVSPAPSPSSLILASTCATATTMTTAITTVAPTRPQGQHTQHIRDKLATLSALLLSLYT